MGYYVEQMPIELVLRLERRKEVLTDRQGTDKVLTHCTPFTNAKVQPLDLQIHTKEPPPPPQELHEHYRVLLQHLGNS